ncbi:MAG: DEAD/DEAH box helicase [Lutimonas sp.]
MSLTSLEKEERKIGKKLYGYQQGAIEKIFDCLENYPSNYNLLYQLPTGGGKTVIFSEIARKYIATTGKKVLILTHRIELSKQTSHMLDEFGVPNKIIDSNVKEVRNDSNYHCFVAMVETLNNRLKEGKVMINDIGMVIVDEAHYNSFRKLFKYFEFCFILGVTATPLSSNINLPMHEIYKDLIVGENISSLIEKGFLAEAATLNFNVSLTSLKIGINGDYTVKSSEELYIQTTMQQKLLKAYELEAKGTKTLIFNNGIMTSRFVYETFLAAGYKVKYIDNTNTKEERRSILKWFKETPDAVLTSVSILTTGFDEPTIETIIINRATRSLALYFQMIGRGSRVIAKKDKFKILDLGNNVARFGLWTDPIDWNYIFKNPNIFLESLRGDDEIEKKFTYQLPDEIKRKFSKTENLDFDIKMAYQEALDTGKKSKLALEKSVKHHAQMCVENSESIIDAYMLSNLLKEDIAYRIKQYSYCIMKSSTNYLKWLEEDYQRLLKLKISKQFNNR